MMKVQIKILNDNFHTEVNGIKKSVQEMEGVSSITPDFDAKFYCFEIVFDENVADLEKILKKVQTTKHYSSGLKIRYDDLQKLKNN